MNSAFYGFCELWVNDKFNFNVVKIKKMLNSEMQCKITLENLNQRKKLKHPNLIELYAFKNI